MIDDLRHNEPSADDAEKRGAGVVVSSTSPADGEPGADAFVEDFDADAMVRRLYRNALWSLIGVAIVVLAIWRQLMPVVGGLLGGGLVLLNFVFLERLAAGALGSGKPAPNPLQVAFLGLRVVLMALMLYGIFVLPGVHPIPVAMGLSILVLAVVIESLSSFSAISGPRA